jgi:uncharacterized repeat protein (TIGR03803 family)
MFPFVMSRLQGAACAAVVLACVGLSGPSVAADAEPVDGAPVFKNLHVFRSREGDAPSELIEASDGNLYGVNALGGRHGRGTLYRMNRDRVVEVLHDFWAFAEDGGTPYGAVFEASDGAFYGTTWYGGSSNAGTIYRYGLDGTYTVLHSFGWDPDGGHPACGVVQASDGFLYGTASSGGSNIYRLGLVFRMSLDGTGFSVLHAFSGDDGAYPIGALIEGQDGLLYGTTSEGGPLEGTAFSLSTGGTFTMLHGFTDAEGHRPSGLTQGSNGQLYGTTAYGGRHGGGTAFRMTPGGRMTVLHAFPQDSADGRTPMSPLLPGRNGDLYGTTHEGGESGCRGSGCGVVFRIAADGTETILHAFVESRPGVQPDAGLTAVGPHGLVGVAGAFTIYSPGGAIFGLREVAP